MLGKGPEGIDIGIEMSLVDVLSDPAATSE